MNAVSALAARSWANLRNEVLVLPSRIAVLVWALALLLLPLMWGDAYVMRVITMAAIFAIFAASWDLLAGYSGQVSFGHAIFFGVGAYTSALLSKHFDLSPWLTMPIGAAAAVLCGMLVGLLCLRMRGSYLSLATMSFPLILLGLLFALPDLSGGELGISGVRRAVVSPVSNYYLAVVVMLAAVFGIWKIGDSKFGLILHAIREDEVACRASGINTPRYKVLAFVLSALFAGIAGALFAHFMRLAGPSTLELALSFQVVIWCVFGGMATVYGPVLAVFILYPLTDFLGGFDLFRDVRLLVFAVIVLLVLLFMPRGLGPWLRDRAERVCPRCKSRNVFTRKQCRLCEAELQ